MISCMVYYLIYFILPECTEDSHNGKYSKNQFHKIKTRKTVGITKQKTNFIDVSIII